jgi:hypothetical protein
VVVGVGYEWDGYAMEWDFCMCIDKWEYTFFCEVVWFGGCVMYDVYCEMWLGIGK